MIALAMACQLASAPALTALSPQSAEASHDITVGSRSAFLVERQALPAVMSFVVPGSGQVSQGRYERGLLHLAAAGTLWLLMSNAESQQNNLMGPTGTGANVRVISALGLLGLTVWSPLDAWLFGGDSGASDAAQARSSFLRK